ncbi:MAG: glycosyltransferase, partial [Geminicoccaceae bacterium]
VLGMTWVYLLPPLAVLETPLSGAPALAGLGALACVLMVVAYLPTLRLYRLRLGWAATLPVAVCLYLAMTMDSAIRHRRGQGGLWKGRVSRA